MLSTKPYTQESQVVPLFEHSLQDSTAQETGGRGQEGRVGGGREGGGREGGEGNSPLIVHTLKGLTTTVISREGLETDTLTVLTYSFQALRITEFLIFDCT